MITLPKETLIAIGRRLRELGYPPKPRDPRTMEDFALGRTYMLTIEGSRRSYFFPKWVSFRNSARMATDAESNLGPDHNNEAISFHYGKQPPKKRRRKKKKP